MHILSSFTKNPHQQLAQRKVGQGLSYFNVATPCFKYAQLLLTSQKILQLHVCIYEDIRPAHYIVQISPH